MAARKLPTARSFWSRHERLILDVFRYALRNLRQSGDLPKSGEVASQRLEDAISLRLAAAVREAAFDLGLDYPPKWEMPRPPESEADIHGPGVGKRPDFTSEIRDPAPTGSADAWLFYHVECKCLGEPPSRTWIYNENYVSRGIRRFLDPKHGYGERSPSGAMIGYVLSMELEQITEEVNKHLRKPPELGAAPPIRFPDSTPDQPVETSQVLDRPRIVPQHFALRHIWVDLRSRH